MKEEITQTVEAIVTHPKTSIAIVAASQANIRWMEYAEPYLEIITTILGVVVLALLVVKHSISIFKELSSKDNQDKG